MEFTKEQLEYARRRIRLSKFSALMGFQVAKLSNGGAVLTVTTEDRHRQIHNVMHGGVIAALADTAAAVAAYTVVPPGTEIVTIELKINYLLQVRGGILTAEGKVLRAGRNFIVVECDVTRVDGSLAAKALMTFGAAPGHAIATKPSVQRTKGLPESKGRKLKVARPTRTKLKP